MKANLENFEKLVSTESSKWLEEAIWREKNAEWLDLSTKIAIRVLRTIRAKNINQTELAKLLVVSPQYVNKILKGTENLSLETICKLQTALGIELVSLVGYNYASEYFFDQMESEAPEKHIEDKGIGKKQSFKEAPVFEKYDATLEPFNIAI